MRVLGAGFEDLIAAEPTRFLLPDGRLDFGLLRAWRRAGPPIKAADMTRSASGTCGHPFDVVSPEPALQAV